MKYLATINVPGYLPMDDDPPIFDAAREAWAYLADERRDAEDSAFQPGDDTGFSATVNMLESLGDGTLSLDEVGVDGTGSVGGVTPGYTGDHDLGLIYSVSIVEPCVEGEHVVKIERDVERGTSECTRCGKTTPEPETFEINERVVSMDTVTWAPAGFMLEGGHAAVVIYHTFANPWADDEHVKGFPTRDAAEEFIVGRYGKTSDELIYGEGED